MSALRPFAVDLAGLVVAFAAEGEDWRGVLEPRYGAFSTALPPRFVLRLAGRGRPAGATELARLASEPVTLTHAGSRLELRSSSIEARVDLASGRGAVTAPVHRHGVDLVLRALLALACENALVVHGALAAAAGRAFLCAGPSGAGKSTLAALLGERGLCDELTLLRREADGWSAHALPFWHGRPGGGRLAGVRVLAHGERHELKALPAAEALRRIAAEVVWPSFSAAAAERTLALVERLLAEVPVAELAFRPDAGVWPVLAGEAAA